MADVIHTMEIHKILKRRMNKKNRTATAQQTAVIPFSAGKRLYRDPDSGLITGVCAGLSAYFGINDPIWCIVFILSR